MGWCQANKARVNNRSQLVQLVLGSGTYLVVRVHQAYHLYPTLSVLACDLSIPVSSS